MFEEAQSLSTLDVCIQFVLFPRIKIHPGKGFAAAMKLADPLSFHCGCSTVGKLQEPTALG
jgi:hypothetical protein